MRELRFDGRTAVVTGAGGDPGLGRAHALLLASRGANIVVNDLGGDRESPGYERGASAEAVAAEIQARGGRAVADTHSVATPEGAEALIAAAVEAFGGVDILVNNAAVVAVARFDQMTARDYERQVQVNLLGSIWVARAAWPHMRERGYGRIVNTGSGAMNGMALYSAYGATKGGIFSLTRALAAEGAALGIKANTVNPFAYTRMTESTHLASSPLRRLAEASFAVEMVSPLVAFLAHEDCPVSGECFAAGGGRVSRVVLSETRGLTDPALTAESLAAGWAQVMDMEGASALAAGSAESLEEHAKPYRG